MKKKNIWKLIWIVGMYVVLVSLLYLVVLYKVKWEDKDLNKYLYFYNCGNQICTSEQKPENYYNNVLCSKDICPHIVEINDDLVILSNGSSQYVYNYKNGEVVNDSYKTYKFANWGYFIVTNENNLQGIINKQGEVIVDFNYETISNYKNDYVSFIQDGKYGIDNEKEDLYIEPEYDDIVLINEKYYAYLENKKYTIASYNTLNPVSDNRYDYVYSNSGAIIVFRNKQIDILDDSLKSKLILKIDTYYSYNKEQERESLDFKQFNNLLLFSVYTGNDSYKHYIYDISAGKLYS